MRTTLLAATVAIVAFGGACSPSAPESSAPIVRNTGAKATPPESGYDAIMLLCNAGHNATDYCGSEQATPEEVAAIAERLRYDSNVGALYFLSRIGIAKVRQSVPSVGRTQAPTESTPEHAAFLVALTDRSSQRENFVRAYLGAPGVDETLLCVGEDICQVNTLRVAGVLR